jgi:hypothetical protein
MKRTIVVFTAVDVNNLVKKNYTFSLRIKSNLDSPEILNAFNVKYVKLTDLSWKTVYEGDIFIFYKAQFFLKSIFDLVTVLKKIGKKVVFDLDDYYFDLPSYSFSRHLNEGSRLRNMIKSIGNADVVTVSTPFLQSQLLKYNKNTIVCENTIVTDNFKKPCGNSGVINILVTSGDNLKLNGFKKDFLDCLMNIKEEFLDRVCIHFLGKFSNISNISQIADRISDRIPPVNYLKFLKENDFHIGLVPLGAEEDPETFVSHSSKSNIKFLEFAAHGIAGIYTEIEPYKAVTDQFDGIKIRNEKSEWCSAIKRLINDQNLRHKIVLNSQMIVKSSFGKGVSQAKWLDFLTRISGCIQRRDYVKYNIPAYIHLEYVVVKYHINLIHQKFLFLKMLLQRREYREIRTRMKNILRTLFGLGGGARRSSFKPCIDRHERLRKGVDF